MHPAPSGHEVCGSIYGIFLCVLIIRLLLGKALENEKRSALTNGFHFGLR